MYPEMWHAKDLKNVKWFHHLFSLLLKFFSKEKNPSIYILSYSLMLLKKWKLSKWKEILIYYII